MSKTQNIKTTHIILSALLSGLLLGMSYWPWSPFFTAFVAVVPLIWLGRRTTIGQMAIAAFLASSLAVIMADWEIWQRHGALGGSLILFLQAMILSLPWLSFHLIHHRHNPKLGIWVLIGSWLTIEWASAQFLGWWQGFQLGYTFLSWPILVQWYAILGVTGGTLWALAVNSQLYRLFFPANPADKKAGIINLVIFMLVPLLYSFFSFYNGKTDAPKTIHLVETLDNITDSLSDRIILMDTNPDALEQYNGNQSVLSVRGQRLVDWLYNIKADTLLEAKLSKSSQLQKIPSRSLQVSGIDGFSQVNSHLLKWDTRPLGMFNRSSLMHSELIRFYKMQGVSLFLAFEELEAPGLSALGSSRLRRLAQARALENRTPLLLVQADRQSLYVQPSGYSQPLGWKAGAAKIELTADHDSFYSNYGNLLGRVSIFLTVWLLLATVVKPYRKK